MLVYDEIYTGKYRKSLLNTLRLTYPAGGLPPKPKFTLRHLKKGIQEFHRKFVFAPADKAANNVVVV